MSAGELSRPASLHRLIAWQGWSLRLPRRWDPVKLEGTYAAGHALFADAVRPRLGLRWQTPKQNRKFDPARAVALSLRQEVGQLAFAEAVPVPPAAAADGLLFTEPEPPGRDVFAAFFPGSGRLVQIVYHARRRENLFAGTILPTLADLPVDRATVWSVFDLNCVVPGGMELLSHRLHAGDLGLTFADRRDRLTVRQIAVASLALARQNLDGWLLDQHRNHKRYHRPAGPPTDVTPGDPASLGRASTSVRRRRYFLLSSQPPRFHVLALHDTVRDRLLLVESTNEPLAHAVAKTLGSAAQPDSPDSNSNRK